MIATMYDVETLGQVFTPEWIVQRMLALRKGRGWALEPSSGDGAFLAELGPRTVGIELDERHIADSRVTHGDFFDYRPARRFPTIIGNPPYVRARDIRPETLTLINGTTLAHSANLYLHFIWRCMDLLTPRGEIIFITPRDFLKATAARELNARLYREGSFTYFEDLGDQSVFPGFSPNCAIWRWEKGRTDRMLEDGREFCEMGGTIWFGSEGAGRLGDSFEVKVGAASGADTVFTTKDHANREMVCSRTAATGSLRPMLYQEYHEYLEPHKGNLMARRLRHFTEENWWQWGRGYPDRPGARIYVNTKTREAAPFFVSEATAFDGSVLALFPLEDGMDLDRACASLNAASWDELGYVCDGRMLFTQRSLTSAPVEVRA